MTFIYNSQLINAINKSRPDVIANYYVLQNFIEDIKKRNTPNFNNLCDYLLFFLNSYGKGCIDYLNDEFNQSLYMKKNNEHLMNCLCRSINSICFKEEEIEYLRENMKHFDYT